MDLKKDRLANTKLPKATPSPSKQSPSPEQILNSGSIEKAISDSAAAQTPEKKGIILQMGSFADRKTAELQIAKLRSLGISANVVEANVNNKKVFRVHSNNLTPSDANNLIKKLKSNGIDSFVHSRS